jgi:hypothetical protein
VASAPKLAKDMPPWLRPTATGVALVALWLWLRNVGSFQVDDAYIVYRYADNLAAGEGFVFNPGERVEGVSTFLWTLALAPFAALGLPLTRVAPLLSCLCGLAAIVVAVRLSARMAGLERPDVVALCAGLAIATHPTFAFWSSGAIGGAPFTLLLLLAIDRYLRDAPSGRLFVAGLWFGVAGLTRPETPLYLAAVLGDVAWRARAGWPEGFRRARGFVLGVAAVMGPFLVFRLLYFGDWLPNTYYAKSGTALGLLAREASFYSLNFFATLVPHPALLRLPAVIASAVVVAALVAWGLRRPSARPLALLVALVFLAILTNGPDWMPASRFWLPGLPFIYLLAAAFARETLLPRRLGAPIAALLFLVAVGFNVTRAQHELTRPGGALNPDRQIVRVYREISDLLLARAEPGDRLALMDIGQIGYETGLEVLDISGLVTPWVAKSPGGFLDKRYPVARLLEEPPRFFVLRPRHYSIDARIVRDPLFRELYRPVLSRLIEVHIAGREEAAIVVFERWPEERPPASG